MDPVNTLRYDDGRVKASITLHSNIGYWRSEAYVFLERQGGGDCWVDQREVVERHEAIVAACHGIRRHIRHVMHWHLADAHFAGLAKWLTEVESKQQRELFGSAPAA